MSIWNYKICPDASYAKIAYSPQLDILAALAPGAQSPDPVIVVSFDGGETWTTKEIIGGNPYDSSWADICWDGVQFLVVCGSQAYKRITSTDGEVWTISDIINIPLTVNSYCEMSRIKHVPELGVYIALKNPSIFYTSLDGETFTERVAQGGGIMNDFCYASGLGFFVGVGDAVDNGSIYTMDPATWVWVEQLDHPVFGSRPMSIVWAPELPLLVIGYANFQTSSNGVNWAEHLDEPPEGGDEYGALSLVWSAPRHLFVGSGAKIRESTNGEVWTRQVNPNEAHLSVYNGSTIYGGAGDRIVIVGASYSGHENNILISIAPGAGLVPVGQPIRFEAGISGPFVWDFNDGEEEGSTNQNVVRSFKTSGTKLVTLNAALHDEIVVADTSHFTRTHSAIDVTTGADYTDKWTLRLAGPIWLGAYVNAFVADGADPATQRLRAFDADTGVPYVDLTIPTADYLDVSQGRMLSFSDSLWFVGNTPDLFYMSDEYTSVEKYTYSGYFLKALTFIGSYLWVLATRSQAADSTGVLLKIDPASGLVTTTIDLGSRSLSPEMAHLSSCFWAQAGNESLAFFWGSPMVRPSYIMNVMSVVDTVSDTISDFEVPLASPILASETSRSFAWVFSAGSTKSPVKLFTGDSDWRQVEFEETAVLVYQIEWVDDQNFLAFCRDYSINSTYTGAANAAEQKNSGMGFVGLWNVILRQWVWQVWDWEWIQDPNE